MDFEVPMQEQFEVLPYEGDTEFMVKPSEDFERIEDDVWFEGVGY